MHISPVIVHMKTKENPFQFNETDELLDIRYDNNFKAVFTKDTPESKGALSGLISALIERKIVVETIKANEPAATSTFDRSIRFDIASKAISGELINVEMTLFPEISEVVRLEYYSSRLFSGQDIKGILHGYSGLVETFQIAIIGKKIYQDKNLVHTFEYYDKYNNISFGGRSKIIIVELPKVMEKPTADMNTSERWSFFLQYLTNKGKREKINEILKEEEGIAMAGKTLVNISQSEIDFARETTELKRLVDYKSAMASYKLSGIAEGMKKGHIEEKFEIARKMKNAGRPISEIEEFTGLTSESIKGL